MRYAQGTSARKPSGRPLIMDMKLSHGEKEAVSFTLSLNMISIFDVEVRLVVRSATSEN